MESLLQTILFSYRVSQFYWVREPLYHKSEPSETFLSYKSIMLNILVKYKKDAHIKFRFTNNFSYIHIGKLTNFITEYKFGHTFHLGLAMYPYEITSIETLRAFGESRSTKKYLQLDVYHFTRHASILTSNDFIIF